MRFVHFSDTHLGKRQFKLEEREKDFEAAFKQVIDFAIENNVDFVVHSGDIFDTARPPTRSLVFAIEQLRRLKDEGIKFFAIPGSHDMGVEESILNVLEKVGLLLNLANQRYYEIRNDKIAVKGEKIGNAWICGIAGKRAGIKRVYAALMPELGGEFNIFMFHHAINDVAGSFADIQIGSLPLGFDYYAGGHWHSKYQRNYGKGILIYPGSTEFCDAREMWNDEAKYFVYYDGKPNFIKINTRKIKKEEIKFEGSGQELMQKIIAKMNKGNGEIFLLKVKGKVKKKVDLDRRRLNEIARQSGYLYFKLIDETTEATQFVQIKRKSVDEIEYEFLKNLGYDDSQISIAKLLIENLGKEVNEIEKQALIKHLEEIYEAKENIA